MNRTIIIAIAACAALCSCGDKKQPDKPTTAKPTPAKVVASTNGETRKLRDTPLTEKEVANYRIGVEEAMAKIPPELRNDFQKAFECQAQKNATVPPAQQIEMDGTWIVNKTAQIKADRTSATTC